MDLELKQRIVGAVVVIGFALLAIFFWLSHKTQPVRTVTYQVNRVQPEQKPVLATKARPVRKKRIRVQKTRSIKPLVTHRQAKKVAAVEIDLPAAPVLKTNAFIVHSPTQKAVVPKKVEMQPKPVVFVKSVRPKPAVINKGWAVQLATFSKLNYADALVQKLKKQGYTALTKRYENSNGKTLLRVLVGPQTDRQAAQTVINKLQQDLKLTGYGKSVV